MSSTQFTTAVFDSLPDNIVVIDDGGKVVSINNRWKEFAVEYGFDLETDWIGHDYIEFCEKFVGLSGDSIKEACAGVKSVLSGIEGHYKLDYINNLLNEEHWFCMIVSGFEHEDRIWATIIHRNITESKQQEFELKSSEEEFRSLMEQAPFSIQIMTPDGKILKVNQAFKDLWGIPEEDLPEVLAKYNVLEDEEVRKLGLLPLIKKSFRGENITLPEFEYEAKKTMDRLGVDTKANKVWIQPRLYPVKNKRGKVFQVIQVEEDITTRKIAEKNLEESRVFTDNLVESADLLIVGLDKKGKVNLFNPAAERISGYTLQELQNKNWFDILAPKEVYPEVHKEFDRLMKGAIPRLFQNPILTKKGEERFIAWTNSEIRQDGEIIGLLSLGMDITERKKIEKNLKDSEERFRLLVEQSPYSIQIFNTDGRIDKVNEAFKELWGVSGEALQEVVDNYNVLEDAEAVRLGVASAIQNVFSGGESVILPLIEYDAESTLNEAGIEVKANKRWIQARLYPLKNIFGEVVSVVDMEEDMTQVIQYQQRLKNLASELTLAEEKQRRIIASDLHDHVGQLLASCRFQLVALMNTTTDPKVMNSLSGISDNLIQAVKDTRNIISNLSLPQLNELGLAAAIEDWMEEQLHNSHGLEIDCQSNKLIFPMEEETRIIAFRSIRELLTNVTKHAQAKKVRVKLEQQGDKLYILISDDGIGFDYNPEIIRLNKMSGFGLFSIQERMQDIGGSMKINSSKGMGSKVLLTIPLQHQT